MENKEEVDTDILDEELPPDSDSQIPKTDLGALILKNKSFDVLAGFVGETTLRGVREMGFKEMTPIQAQSIPHLLDRRDVLAAAKTGSGKTLAFLIPVLDLIERLGFKARNGTGAVIISPTRELAMQTYGVLRDLAKFHNVTYGLVMGGTNRAEEAKKLAKGINILVATPGKLMDHLKNTINFLFKNLQCLVIDEADRILQVGFEEEMKEIVKLLPKKRQTVLFSATQTQKTEDLARISLKKHIYIGVDDGKEVATVEGLKQGYLLCPSEQRFLILFKFLKRNRKQKVMVFFSSCMAVKFFHRLLNYIDIPVMCIHGKMKQSSRTETFFSFCKASEATLLCTDVAARGLDIPVVHCIVQYDPPSDPTEYIHRVGRTARGVGGVGHALLFLTPSEVTFLFYLEKAKVILNEYVFKVKKESSIQAQLEKLVNTVPDIHNAAKEAYKGYVRSYVTHAHKNIFNVSDLDLKKVALSFGLTMPPSVNTSGPRPGNKRKNEERGGPNKKKFNNNNKNNKNNRTNKY